MDNVNNNSDVHMDDIELPAKFPSEEDLELPVFEMAELDENIEISAAATEVKSEIENEIIDESFSDSIVSDEVLWQARTGLNSDTLCGAIETIIFMSDKPVSIQKIKSLIDAEMPLKVVHEALQRLQAEYEQKHHGLRLLEVAEGYQYRTKATYSKYVQDIFKINSLVLSPTALEVLAIIAYKQPCSKVEVDKIRGVDSGHIVRALMDKRLVKVTGRSDELGRPVLYGTTPEFLEVFNLPDLAALPPEHELDEMSRASSVGKIADIKTLVNDGADKARFKFDEIEELDMLSESIKNISSETDFTASLKVEEKKRMSEDGAEVKSAFDLLEEFVNKRLISEQNKQAIESLLTTNVIDPRIIDDLEAGPFNVPQEDEEEFQMIDLDTGLPIEYDAEFDGEIDENGNYESGLDESEFDIIVDLDFDKEESEEEALSKALDAAFENLTGESLDSRLSDEEFAFGGELEERSQSIDDITNGMIEKAQDLDLDLSFLKDPSAENDDSDDRSQD
ncbi:SMC-Scp complex subunit ScpB [Bacteriovorax stolpii]|uniref:SMC-Scp complex subunit ScpB n=1 Tax=Bacteriovorax stolpii TaxID=960 RepID=A0A2K9NQ26_BACTC|nr:SMC-Scp complex subunit ScpB [Bacteriovorax stolpii]AUN96874.1 SMC-Scp complex subunit ScpB [Bacteriovorax stolpii]TDP53152.1 segregation and condensation protein B [Bacteriovorax stolpii]